MPVFTSAGSFSQAEEQAETETETEMELTPQEGGSGHKLVHEKLELKDVQPIPRIHGVSELEHKIIPAVNMV